jgi:hypothetical protein
MELFGVLDDADEEIEFDLVQRGFIVQFRREGL